MNESYQVSIEEYIPIGAPLVPMDTVEFLRQGGDPLLIEAAMLHLMREFEIGQDSDEWMEGGSTI